MNLYFAEFEHPIPIEVTKAHLTYLALSKPTEIMSFLQKESNQALEMITDLLLRFGFFTEYKYVLTRISSENFLEYLINQEEWNEISEYLKNNPKMISYVQKISCFEKK